jgi:ABC-2 type transport system permease protein
MRALTVLVRIRIAELVRKPISAFWFFALPVLLLGIFSGLFANGHPFERHHVAVVGAMRLPGSVTADIVRDEAEARSRIEARVASAAVVGDRVLVGSNEELLGRGLVAALPGLRLEIVPLSARGYVRFLVPGLLAQGVVVAGLFGMGYTLVRYRESRFLRKLASTPLSKTEFILAQLVARSLLVSLQLVLLLAVTHWTLGVPLSSWNVSVVLAVGNVGLVAFMGIGFCLASWVQHEGQVVDIINSLLAPIAMFSEIFFSSTDLPPAVSWFTGALPSTAMVRVFRAALLGQPIAFTAPLAVLGLWSALSFGLAVRSFRWK